MTNESAKVRILKEVINHYDDTQRNQQMKGGHGLPDEPARARILRAVIDQPIGDPRPRKERAISVVNSIAAIYAPTRQPWWQWTAWLAAAVTIGRIGR